MRGFSLAKLATPGLRLPGLLPEDAETLVEQRRLLAELPPFVEGPHRAIDLRPRGRGPERLRVALVVERAARLRMAEDALVGEPSERQRPFRLLGLRRIDLIAYEHLPHAERRACRVGERDLASAGRRLRRSGRRRAPARSRPARRPPPPAPPAP